MRADTSKARLILELRQAGITDTAVLAAIERVPRELFVPPAFTHQAWRNVALPIGSGQTISQPEVVARMTQALEPGDRMKVLEIGTGSGYQTAILAELAGEVYTIEIVESLMERSKELLDELGYENIEFKTDDGYFGWEEYAPFDVIIVTCGPDSIPQPLVEQLAEGGCLIIPVGSMYQILTIVEKVDGKIKKHKSISCRFVPMTGQH